jgi:hypothetical protein
LHKCSLGKCLQILCTTASSSAHSVPILCQKRISFKNLLQNKKWCRKTAYSFGKLKRSFISFANGIFLQLILLLLTF